MSLPYVSLGARIFVLVILFAPLSSVVLPYVLQCFSGFLDFALAIILSIFRLHFKSFFVHCFRTAFE